MEPRHFTHSIEVTRISRSEDRCERQFVGVWDARSYTEQQLDEYMPELLRELELGEASHFDAMPWLRALLLVTPRPSDALTLSVMDRGVVVLEAPREDPAVQVIEQFLYPASHVQSIAKSKARTASSPSRGGDGDTDSEFSRTPAYFARALYNEWLEKLSQPWCKEDAFDSES